MRDPQKLSGTQVYTALSSCVCGHLVTVHMLSETTRKRMQCSAWMGGKCRCKRFEVADEVA